MAIVFIITFYKRCNSFLLDKEHALNMIVWAFITAIIGARLFFVLQHIPDFIQNPALLLKLNGGTVSFGVYMGGIFGFVLYNKYYGLPIGRYLDIAASIMGLAIAIGRIGCFLVGDDFGTLTNVPWAVRFPQNSFSFRCHVQQGLIEPDALFDLPVHPVQLYESMSGLFLFILFSMLLKRQLFKPGVLFFMFWICYSVSRFLIEFYRGDADRGFIGPFSTGQLMSLIFIFISIICLYSFYNLKLKLESIPENKKPNT